jgi:hypothetical protein
LTHFTFYNNSCSRSVITKKLILALYLSSITMNPLHLLLAVLPIVFCLNLEIEDASNLHFCHIGDVAGTVGMAHVLMRVNVTLHLTLMKPLCTIPPHVGRMNNLSLEQLNLIKTLEHRLRKREDWTLWGFFLVLHVDHIMTNYKIVI